MALENYTLELTLLEKGDGSSLAYTDADHNSQNTAAIQEQLTHFTTKKELSPTGATLAIPMTLHPGTGVKEVIITINLTAPENTQIATVVWQLFTPSLITDDMMKNAASNRDLSDLLQKLKGGEQLRPDEKNQAIRQAAIFGDPEIFKALLEVPEMDIRAQNSPGNTPLYLAAVNGHKELVKLLLVANAAINTTGPQAPLDDDALEEKIAEILLEDVLQKLKDGKFLTANEKDKALKNATNLRNWVAVEILLQLPKLVYPNAEHEGGKTWLQTFAFHNQVRSVQLILNAKADVNKSNNGGITPLHLAVLMGNLDVAKVLLDAKADVNKSDNGGITPLHMAVYKGHLEVVKWLVNNEANPNAKHSTAGYTPLDLAKDPAIQQYLTPLTRVK